MKLIHSLKRRTERVDVQVSLLACGLICFSCIIMFLVTFSVMKAMLKDAYGSSTDVVSNAIASHIRDELYRSDISDEDYGKELNYLTAMMENMPADDIIIYRRDENGNVVYALDAELKNDSKNINGVTVEDATREDIEKLMDAQYYENGDFYKVNGSFRYMKFYPMYDNLNNIKGAVGISVDVHDLYVAEQILRVLFFVIILLGCFISILFARNLFKRISNPLYRDVSNTDALTEFKNKNSFSVDLHNIEVSGGKRYSVISADLNGLKTINDTLGHQMGDIYLKRAAKVIGSVMDGENAVCYRIGGDEFTVILKDKVIDELEKLVGRIDEEVENDNRKNSGVKLSISLGYAQFDSTQDKNFSMTIERSDKMMYENKRLYYQENNIQQR